MAVWCDLVSIPLANPLTMVMLLYSLAILIIIEVISKALFEGFRVPTIEMILLLVRGLILSPLKYIKNGGSRRRFSVLG